MPRSVLGVANVVLCAALCACGGSNLGPPVSGTIKMLNGVTNIAGPSGTIVRAVRLSIAKNATTASQWRLTPQKMTATITGLGFAAPGADVSNHPNQVSLTNCTATYDQAQASLQSLGNCAFTAPSGTYGSVTIAYSATFQVLENDATNGIYSDPSTNSLTTTAPAAGAGFIPVVNGPGGTLYMTTFFQTPVVIDSAAPPTLSIVFNPIHWMNIYPANGSLGAIQMQGNPPLIGTLGTMGKAELYSNMTSIQSFNPQTCSVGNDPCSSFLVLYSNATTAQSVSQVEGNLNYCLSTPASDPNIAFPGNTLNFGSFGMLGVDNTGVLSWALPGTPTPDNTAITGYRAVMEMNEVTTLGASTTLTYSCTTTPPTPAGGAVNYSSGHPTITPSGTLALKLLAH